MKIFYSLITILSLFTYKINYAQADNCSAATPIGVTINCASPTSGTTIGASQNIAGCVGNADDDVWYQFVATSTSHQIIVVPSASMDPVVQLFSGVCSSLTTISCMDATFTGQNEVINATGLSIGSTYRIRVYHYGVGSGSGTFTICVTNPPPAPSNNNCAGATNLLINTSCVNTAATTIGATQSMTGCAGNADDDVWFSFTAVNTTATITVNPSSLMDPVLEVFSGTCGTLNSLQCEDIAFTNGNEIINLIGLTPGSTYFIRVYDYYGGGGYPFDICITGPAASAIPTNDEPCSAIALPAVTSDCNFLQFSTVGATASMGAPTPSSCVGGGAPQQGGFSAGSADIWFSVVAPANGQITITSQPNFGINDGVMALYSGTCGALTQIACSDDNNYPGTTNDFKPYISQTGLTPGATYYIRYWGFGTTSGNFGFCVSSPTNDFCSTALYICDLNGYSGSTSAAYTPDRPCNMRGNAEQNNPPTYTYTPGTNTGGIFGQAGPWGTGSSAFDVQINNNSWIRFTAANTTAILNVAIGDCWIGNYPSGGIQMQIFEAATSCCNFTPVSNFEESSTGFTITANNLIIGNDYFLMIDGFAGDICNYTITANSGILFPDIITLKPSICFGDTTTLYGPALSSSYLWMPGGETTQNITVMPSTTTTYTLTVEGVCGNKQTLTKTITVNPLPTILINNGNPVAVCNGSTATLTASGGSTYLWSTGNTANPINVTPASPTSYSVVGTDVNGCVGSDTVTVQLVTNPTANITANSTSICNGENITLQATGGGTYTWNDNSTLDSLVVNPTSNTNYSVIVDVGGCLDTANFPVTVNPLPTPTISGGTAVCVGDSITLTGNGGLAYNWNTGATTNVITVAPTTNPTPYTVIVTDVNGCVDSTTTAITVNALPTITISGNNTICNGGSTILTASGGNSYVWNNGSLLSSISVSPLADTSYIVTGTNINGCSDTSSIFVQVVANPTASISGINTICYGTSTTLTATGGGTYLWNNGSTSSSINVSPLNDSTYSVVIDLGGCKDSTTQFVTVNPLPIVDISGNDTICLGQSTTLVATGGGSYLWNTGSSANSIVETPANNTAYTVVVTDANSCVDSSTINVVVNSNPIALIAGSTIICQGNTTSLLASGGNTYNWNTGATTSLISVSPLVNTTYSVVVTNGNGCTDSTSVLVQVVPNPTASISGTDSICFGSATVLIGGGGGTYLWSSGASTSSISISPSTSTTYSVIVNVGGCVDTAYHTITVNTLPVITIAGNNIICNGESTTLLATGGGSYLWNNGIVLDSITVSPSSNTTYQVIVTNSSACVDSANYSVVVNPLPIITINGNTTICEGLSTNLTATGANNYVWSTNATTSTINVSPISSTSYSVIGTDNNGCSDSSQLMVTVLPQPTAAIIGTTTICFGESTILTASGGNTYFWNTTDTTASITVMPNDTSTYTVIVNNNGCLDSTNYTIAVTPLPLINAYNDTNIILGQSAPIFAQGDGPYNWLPQTGLSCFTCINPIATPNETTTYCVSTTENECINSSCVTVYVDQICGDLFVPNSFSPNGDGNNDCLKVYNNCLEKILFRVYSRWGELIFESNHIEGCWDGTNNGSNLNTGVYTFTVEATLINGEEVSLKGNVTLFK